MFFGLRATPRLRKRPSTRELIDWICRAQEGGRGSRRRSAAASRSSARCSRPSRTSSSSASGRRRRRAMLIDFLFELRAPQGAGLHARVDGADARRSRSGLHETSLDGFYHLCRALLRQGHRALRRVRRGVPRVLQGRPRRRARSSPRSCRSGSPIPKRSRRSPTEQRDAARGARPRGAARAVRAAPAASRRSATTAATAGSAPAARRRSARGGTNPTGMRVGGGGGAPRDGRSPTSGASSEYRTRRRARRAPDRRRAARRCASSAARARTRSSTSTRPIDETAQNAGELEIVFRPPRRNRVKVLLLMDVGGSMDPHAELVSRLFTAASRSGPVREVPQLLLPQLRLRLGLRGRAVPQAGAGRRPARDQRSRREARRRRRRARCTRPSCSIRAARCTLYAQTARPGIEWLRRLARALPQRRVAQPRARALLGRHDDRGDRERVPDVPAHARRPRAGGALPRARRREAAASAIRRAG